MSSESASSRKRVAYKSGGGQTIEGIQSTRAGTSPAASRLMPGLCSVSSLMVFPGDRVTLAHVSDDRLSRRLRAALENKRFCEIRTTKEQFHSRIIDPPLRGCASREPLWRSVEGLKIGWLCIQSVPVPANRLGMLTLNTVPSPAVEVTSICPPCLITAFSVI